jgi:hypothetical protein
VLVFICKLVRQNLKQRINVELLQVWLQELVKKVVCTFANLGAQQEVILEWATLCYIWQVNLVQIKLFFIVLKHCKEGIDSFSL